MIKLNLLSPQAKEELEFVNINKLLSSMMIWIVLFLIFFSLLLVSIFIYLFIISQSQNRLIQSRQDNPEIQQLALMENKIKEANKLISQTYSRQEQLISWTPIIEKLTELVPDGMYLTNLNYQLADNQVSLNGWSNTRENILLFQKALEDSAMFTDVQSPLSNLLKRENIYFNLTFKPIK